MCCGFLIVYCVLVLVFEFFFYYSLKVHCQYIWGGGGGGGRNEIDTVAFNSLMYTVAFN